MGEKCKECGIEADFATSFDELSKKALYLCRYHYEKWSRKDLPRRELSNVQRLRQGIARAELGVEPSHMERALVEQELDERQGEIIANIEDMRKVLYEDE